MGGRAGMEGSLRGPHGPENIENIGFQICHIITSQSHQKHGYPNAPLMQMIGTCSKEREWAEVFQYFEYL